MTWLLRTAASAALFLQILLASPASAADRREHEPTRNPSPTATAPTQAPSAGTNTDGQSFDLDVQVNLNPQVGQAPDGTETPSSIPVAQTAQNTISYIPFCARGDGEQEGSMYGCPREQQLTCGGGLVYTQLTTTPDGTTTSGIVCLSPEEEPPPQQVIDIPGLALEAFRSIEMPQPRLLVQPPGGETLVNFPTVVSTTAEPKTYTVPMGNTGITIILDTWPSNYHWDFGDGTTLDTDAPGRAWTEGDLPATDDRFITHEYTDADETFDASVAITWSANFRVAGQSDWQAVNGQVTRDSADVALTILEARPELVE